MRKLWFAFALSFVVTGAMGCMGEGDPLDEDAVDEVSSTDSEAQWSIDETADSSDKGEPSIAAGCTHIQWCNEPGPVGTVCIWDACTLAQAIAECTSDANAVCGGITQPAQVR